MRIFYDINNLERKFTRLLSLVLIGLLCFNILKGQKLMGFQPIKSECEKNSINDSSYHSFRTYNLQKE